MKHEKIEKLKNLLTSNGYVEGEDFEVSAGDFGGLVFSIRVDFDGYDELPEELVPFAWGSYEVERAIHKGNTEKKTWNGANFELALRNYASDLMRKDPETISLEARVKDIDTRPKLDEYQAERQRIWERVCADPKIAAWEEHMNTNLY